MEKVISNVLLGITVHIKTNMAVIHFWWIWGSKIMILWYCVIYINFYLSIILNRISGLMFLLSSLALRSYFCFHYDISFIRKSLDSPGLIDILSSIFECFVTISHNYNISISNIEIIYFSNKIVILNKIKKMLGRLTFLSANQIMNTVLMHYIKLTYSTVIKIL